MFVEQENKHKNLVEFEVGDLVLVHPCKDRFLPWKCGTLKPRVDGPF